jgi:hypothetical protein
MEDNPLFKTIDEWYPPETEGPDEHQKHREHFARFLRCWQFLRPFFASRGFTLYDHGPHHLSSYPPMQLAPDSVGVDVYPYGRRLYENREHGRFSLPPVCVRFQYCMPIRFDMVFIVLSHMGCARQAQTRRRYQVSDFGDNNLKEKRNYELRPFSSRIVSEDELKVLRYLNTKEARSDPRNHTIPLIDSGTFSGLSFSVTPRYSSQISSDSIQCN